MSIDVMTLHRTDEEEISHALNSIRGNLIRLYGTKFIKPTTNLDSIFHLGILSLIKSTSEKNVNVNVHNRR